jgi:hypothetical protein
MQIGSGTHGPLPIFMRQQHDGINLGPMKPGLILKSNFILTGSAVI